MKTIGGSTSARSRPRNVILRKCSPFCGCGELGVIGQWASSVKDRDPLNLARGPLDPARGLGEGGPEDSFDLVEMLLRADERRRELDNGVTAIIGAADQAGVEERRAQEA